MATHITSAELIDDEVESSGRPRLRGRPELLLTPLSFVLLLGFWEFAVHHYAVNAILLPPPSRIARSLLERSGRQRVGSVSPRWPASSSARS